MRDAGEEERRRGSLGDADVPGRPSKEGDALAQPKVGGRTEYSERTFSFDWLVFYCFQRDKIGILRTSPNKSFLKFYLFI